jgi:dTDP-4-dehydrorhamnose 3,5-epimerase-like enzyme
VQRNSFGIIQFPKILDNRGNLSFIQNRDQIPFEIRRAYWIYDVPGGVVRGGHAYKMLEEVFVALSGSFDVAVDDGMGNTQEYNLNRSYNGLYVPGMTWRQIRNFSTNAIALILASKPYDEADYIYDYNDFIQMANDI